MDKSFIGVNNISRISSIQGGSYQERMNRSMNELNQSQAEITELFDEENDRTQQQDVIVEEGDEEEVDEVREIEPEQIEPLPLEFEASKPKPGEPEKKKAIKKRGEKGTSFISNKKMVAVNKLIDYSRNENNRSSTNNYLSVKVAKMKEDSKKGLEFGKYKFGEFSKFAVQKEREIHEVEELIEKTIQEAIYSHLQRLREATTAFNSFFDENSVNESFYLSFDDTGKNMSEWAKVNKYTAFVKDPIGFTISEAVNEKNTNWQNIILKYIERRKLTRESALIQDKIVRVENLAFNEAFQLEGVSYIPSKNRTMFIQLGQSKVPAIVFFDGVSFRTKEELSKLTQRERDEIIGMVQMFLEEKKILKSYESIEDRIIEIMQSVK